MDKKIMKLKKYSYIQFIFLVLLLHSTSIVYADMHVMCNDSNKIDSIYGHLNNDKHLDLITIKSDGDIPPLINLRIYYNLGDNNYSLIKDKEYVALENVSMPQISIAKDGNIFVMEYHYRFVMIYKYKFFKSQNDWALYSTELFDKYDDSFTPSGMSRWPLYDTRLIGTNLEECIDVVTKSEKDSLTQKLNKQYEQFLVEYKAKNYKDIVNYKIEEFYTILRYIGINESNVQKLNDIGFFLCEAGRYRLATEVLESITTKFYERTVAYINLGDAYWGLEETDNANQAYQKYIELMNASGKESKIPRRVFERIKE